MKSVKTDTKQALGARKGTYDAAVEVSEQADMTHPPDDGGQRTGRYDTPS